MNRREAKEIVEYVIREIKLRQAPFTTDGKVDFSRYTIGVITGGDATSGGQIGSGAIYNRHINANSAIAGTKVLAATVDERGAVELAEWGEIASGLVVQSDDPRLPIASGLFVQDMNSLYGSITLAGGDGVTVTVSGQYITISETAGGLDVDSLNSLFGIITISGTGGVSVTTSGQSILVNSTGSDILTWLGV